MPNFWSYIKNDKYAIGCTGQTVYVYDSTGNELSRFKDIIYAYTPMFCPKKNLFVVKSTDANIAVYSLDTLQLIKKFRFSNYKASQDDGFCFSGDGIYFLNIERYVDRSCLSIYETSNFDRIKQLFLSEPSIVLQHIEYNDERDGLFVLGFVRGETGVGVNGSGFVAELVDDSLINRTKIDNQRYEYILGYKRLQLMGFTAKSKEWSFLSLKNCDLENLEHVRLSDVIYNK